MGGLDAEPEESKRRTTRISCCRHTAATLGFLLSGHRLRESRRFARHAPFHVVTTTQIPRGTLGNAVGCFFPAWGRCEELAGVDCGYLRTAGRHDGYVEVGTGRQQIGVEDVAHQICELPSTDDGGGDEKPRIALPPSLAVPREQDAGRNGRNAGRLPGG